MERSRWPAGSAVVVAACLAGCTFSPEGLPPPTITPAHDAEIPVVRPVTPVPSVPDGGARDAPDGAPTERADAAPDGGDRNRCPDEPGLQLCLRFEGMTADESPAKSPVEATGVAYEAAGFGMGMAGHLAPDTAIRVGPSPGLDAATITVEVTLRPSKLPLPGQRAGIIDNALRYSLFLLPGGTLVCSAQGGVAASDGVVRPGEWVTVACMAEAGSVSLWLNGTRLARSLAPGSAGAGAGRGLTVGTNNPTGDHLEGLIDNVLIWNRGRTAEQLCASAPGCR
jgi:hypothetical protein